jgi:ribose transport system substrate-binding protein
MRRTRHRRSAAPDARHHVTAKYRRSVGLIASGVAAISMLLAACGASGKSSSADPNTHYKIGVAWGNLANPAAIGEYAQVVSHIKATGVTLIAPAQADNSSTTQNSQIEQLIARGAQAIMLFGVNPYAQAPAMSYAKSKHVPIVAEDNIPLSGRVYMDVGSNNVLMGNEECQDIGTQLHGTGEALIVLGGLSTTPGQYRADGVLDCLQKNYPHIKILKTPSTNWDPTTAAQYVDTLLPANPDIKAIGLASDGVMLPAVAKTLQQLHKWIPAGRPGHIYLDTIDGTPLALQDIRAGYVDDTVEQPYSVYAQLTATLLIDALKGIKFHTGSHAGIDGDPVVTFAGNLWMQPPAPVVTKANASSKALWGNQNLGS